jgi:hypothetical protein
MASSLFVHPAAESCVCTRNAAMCCPLFLPLLPATLTWLSTRLPVWQSTEALVSRCKGGRPPLTMAAFTKLVDSCGPPPPPALEPPALLVPPGPVDAPLPGTELSQTLVPTWQAAGFKTPPTTIFPVGERRVGALWIHARLIESHCHVYTAFVYVLVRVAADRAAHKSMR